MAEELFGFDKAGAQRIVNATRNAERLNPPPRGGRGRRTVPLGGVILVKTVGAHDKSVAQDVAVYRGTEKGEEADSGETVEAYNRFSDLEDDKWAFAVFIGGGWELIAAEC